MAPSNPIRVVEEWLQAPRLLEEERKARAAAEQELAAANTRLAELKQQEGQEQPGSPRLWTYPPVFLAGVLVGCGINGGAGAAAGAVVDTIQRRL